MQQPAAVVTPVLVLAHAAGAVVAATVVTSALKSNNQRTHYQEKYSRPSSRLYLTSYLTIPTIF